MVIQLFTLQALHLENSSPQPREPFPTPISRGRRVRICTQFCVSPNSGSFLSLTLLSVSLSWLVPHLTSLCFLVWTSLLLFQSAHWQLSPVKGNMSLTRESSIAAVMWERVYTWNLRVQQRSVPPARAASSQGQTLENNCRDWGLS